MTITQYLYGISPSQKAVCFWVRCYDKKSSNSNVCCSHSCVSMDTDLYETV